MKRVSLTVKIFISMILGVVLGIVLQNNGFILDYIRPFGTVYLNLIKMVVIPVVLLSVIQGVVSLKSIKKVGTMGIGTVFYYLLTTALAIALGLVFANLLDVGAGYVISGEKPDYSIPDTPRLGDTFVNIFPSNIFMAFSEGNMLQIIVIAILLSFGIILAGEKGKKASELIDSFSEVFFKIMNIIINLAPIGVFALICPVIAGNGINVLVPLLKVLLVAYLSYLVHMIFVYSALVGALAKISPVKFFKNMIKPVLFAFSSASSVGTLPFNIEAVRNLGCRKEVYSFVLPLGATLNMDGTAIYQGVCAVFIARIFGINLDFSSQITIILTATLASIGTAGVPGSGMIMLSMVLQSVGLPLEGIALLAGIDRNLDMGRTVVNITGDASCALCIDSLYKRTIKLNKKGV